MIADVIPTQLGGGGRGAESPFHISRDMGLVGGTCLAISAIGGENNAIKQLLPSSCLWFSKWRLL